MNFKKILSLGLISVLTVGLLASCSSNSNKDDNKKIVVGASATPHAEVLKEFAKEKLKEKGIELEVKEFSDYPIQNESVEQKQIDANYFQHGPYLEEYNQKKNTNLVSIGEIHAEPLAAYSNKIKSINELANGSTIAIPNDSSNGTRALKLMEKQGLIELKDKDAAIQTERDITSSSKNLKVKAVEAAQLPRVLDDVDLAIINGNYALQAKLNTKNTLFAEEASDIKKHVNIVVTREDNKDNKALKELINVLKSDDAKKFLKDKYGSAIIPAN